mgnify:CR=1 FL=1
MAKFSVDNLKAKNVAIMRDVKSDYSMGLAQYFKETLTKMGGTVVSDQTYSNGDIDFKAQLTTIKGTKPEAIFIPGYYTDVGLIARQARGLGIKVPLLGGDGWDSSKLFEIGGEAIVGNYFSNHYTTDTKDQTARTFIEKYKKDFKGETPDGLAALGYDSAYVLVEAMKRAKSFSPTDIRDEIAKTKDYPGVTGHITLNEQRDAVKPAVVVQVKGKDNTYVTTINP